MGLLIICTLVQGTIVRKSDDNDVESKVTASGEDNEDTAIINNGGIVLDEVESDEVNMLISRLERRKAKKAKKGKKGKKGKKQKSVDPEVSNLCTVSVIFVCM